MRRATVSVGLVALAVVAACESKVDGTPTSSAPQHAAFNPCTDLSDEAVRAASADPASKAVVTDAGPQASTKACGWRSTDGPHSLGIGSLNQSLSDVPKNTKLVNVRETTVGPRQALMYNDDFDEKSDKNSCWVGFDYSGGLIEINIDWDYLVPKTADPCDLALDRAKKLEPYLPR